MVRCVQSYVMASVAISSTGCLSPTDLNLVAYLHIADKYLGPLASRLRGVNQPVISI